MNSRPIVLVTGLMVVLILITAACSAGFIAGRVLAPGAGGIAIGDNGLPELNNRTDERATPQAAGTPQDLETLFEPFWQTWDLVHERYVDQPVDDELLMRGAISGMLEALEDPHTSYMEPEVADELNKQLQGEEYEGIGAWVDPAGDYLKIVSPMPGSPAEEAGLLPGDQVIAVDGEDMTGVEGELVRQRILGPRGTTVRLTILREEEDSPFDVEVKRASILVPSVDGNMLEEDVAYIRLYIFGDKTTKDLRREIKELLAQNPKGLILDLRGNGGGYLETAIDVVSEFIDQGVVMYEEFGNGERKEFEARGGGSATDIPMVVLIDEGSASASEIVAGAIQDLDRGQVVGETSFGKGSVQTVHPLVNEEGQVRVTIARWLTPSGRTINQKGIEPDVKVELTEEDARERRDPQLDKAVELLTQPTQ